MRYVRTPMISKSQYLNYIQNNEYDRANTTSSQPSIEEIEWLKYKVVSHDNIKTSLHKVLPFDQMILYNNL